jgi:hypothetical protein
MDFVPYYGSSPSLRSGPPLTQPPRPHTANRSEPSFANDPVWKRYYSARETYGSFIKNPPLDSFDSLDGSFWHRVTEVFERNASVPSVRYPEERAS